MTLPPAPDFSSDVVQAICWTLVHSLWQGLVLSLLAGLVVQLTRKSAPALRYNLLTGLFVVYLATTGATFWQELGERTTTSLEASLSEVTFLKTTLRSSAQEIALPDKFSTFSQSLTHFCNRYANAIVLGWFVVFFFKCLLLLGGLQYVFRLRREQVQPPAGFWQTRLGELGTALQLRLPVSLLESGLVKVPVVIGFLKPLVLVPAGMLAQLPADQVEAILLHELAHIKRRDYLVNLLQTFAEVLFFFNPGLLWLSARIRKERENCCDELAIQVLQSKTDFLQALVTFQEYNFNRQELTPAFAGTRTSLTDRVRRIIYQDNAPLQRSEKLFLGVCLTLATLLLLSFTNPTVFSVPPRLSSGALEIQLPPRPATVVPVEEEVMMAKISTPVSAQFATESQETPAPSLPHEPEIVEGAARKSCDGLLTTYQFRKEGILYEVVKDSTAILGLKINGEKATQEQVQLYTMLMQDLQHKYEQGAIPIVVNGKVPKANANPENPVHIAFLQNGTITTNRDDQVYEVMVKDHKTVKLTVNGQAVPENAIQHNKDLILDLVKEAETDRVYAELSARAAVQLRRESLELLDQVPTTLPPLEYQEYHYSYTGRDQRLESLLAKDFLRNPVM